MILVPLPLVVASVLIFWLVQAVLRGGSHPLVLALIALSAVQNGMMVLVHHFGLTALQPLVVVMAGCIAPLAFVAFDTSARQDFSFARHGWHLLAPLFIVLTLVFARMALDVSIPMLFFGYGSAILLILRHGSDTLVKLRLDGGERPLMLWRIIAGLLIFSALIDVLIAADHQLSHGRNFSLIINAASVLSLLTLGGFALSQSLSPAQDHEDTAPPAATDNDAALMQRLEEAMTQKKLYLDPDLTLTRLSRRLGVPAKQLSQAVNRMKGENISRYVNTHRIHEACARLKAGDTITSAMLNSGFNTKSNFNREFFRIMGKTPSQWLDSVEV